MVPMPAGRPPLQLLGLVAFLLLTLLGPSAAFGQSVTIDLISFGVGDVMRPGEWIGIKLRLTANSTEAITAQVAWEVPNADGDPCEYTRTVTLAPGQAMDRWIYGMLPPSQNPLDLASTAWSVRVFQMVDGQRVREIGATRVSGASAQTATRPVAMDEDLFLVLGDRRLGLEQYFDTPQPGAVAPPGLQCRTFLASGVTVGELPDRWAGLCPFSAILWCDAERRPSQLKGEQPEALREWVWRGGTLVISVAAAPDSWGLGRPGTHELEDLLPSAVPERQEVLVGEVLPLISKYVDVRDPLRTTPIYSWDPAKLDRGYRPLVAMPSPKNPDTQRLDRREPFHGAIVGVQRNYGFGQIVVLGLEVDQLYTLNIHASAAAGASVPQCDIFWHRILGRRGDTPTGSEMLEYQNAVTDQRYPLLLSNLAFSSHLGEGLLVSQVIGMPGKAVIGVLAAVALFILYWLLSGPIGFLSLKHFRRERNSWVLFVAVAFLFTAVAWAGGSLIADSEANLRHVTVIDQLGNDPSEPNKTKGVPEQRATTWMSILLPRYGLTPISIGSSDQSNSNNLLASWSPPPSGTGDSFPNKDRYTVDADSLWRFATPARKTSADFVARWRGVIDPKWGSPISEVTPVDLREDRTQSPVAWQVVGALKHELPGTLTDVKVMLVSPRRTPQAAMWLTRKPPIPDETTRGQLPLEGRMVSPPRGQWAPGAPLDLSALFGEKPASLPRSGQSGSIARELRERYYKAIVQDRMGQWMTSTIDATQQRLFLEMLTYYWMLEPPAWLRSAGEEAELARAGRFIGREIDLSPWLTRPCLIITGFLDQSSSPVPVSVDGETIGGTGITMYRYILPLDNASQIDFTVPTIEPAEDREVDPAEPSAAEQAPTDSGGRLPSRGSIRPFNGPTR